MLCITLKDKNDNDRKNETSESQRFSKIKKDASNAQSQRYAAHLLLPQRTRKQF